MNNAVKQNTSSMRRPWTQTNQANETLKEKALENFTAVVVQVHDGLSRCIILQMILKSKSHTWELDCYLQVRSDDISFQVRCEVYTASVSCNNKNPLFVQADNSVALSQ